MEAPNQLPFLLVCFIILQIVAFWIRYFIAILYQINISVKNTIIIIDVKHWYFSFTVVVSLLGTIQYCCLSFFHQNLSKNNGIYTLFFLVFGFVLMLIFIISHAF